MGDLLQAGKPSRCVASHPGQLSLAIPPWVDAMSTSESWDVNRHTARCTSPVSVVWQCKLVSGWELMKRRSAPPYGPYGSGRTLRQIWHFYDTSSIAVTLSGHRVVQLRRRFPIEKLDKCRFPSMRGTDGNVINEECGCQSNPGQNPPWTKSPRT